MKILTYNVMTAGKDLLPSKNGWWFTRTVEAMRMLKKENPDIFCLNEVTIFQKLMFMFLFGYDSCGGVLQNHIFWKRKVGGIKVKKVFSKVKKLKTLKEYFRSYTLAILNICGHRYCIVSTHIDWDESTRELQKQEIIEAINKQEYDDVIVCGDFNKENDVLASFTPTNAEEYTYCGGTKIDYIFNTLGIEKCKVLSSYVDISDHYPLVIEF